MTEGDSKLSPDITAPQNYMWEENTHFTHPSSYNAPKRQFSLAFCREECQNHFSPKTRAEKIAVSVQIQGLRDSTMTPALWHNYINVFIKIQFVIQTLPAKNNLSAKIQNNEKQTASMKV